MRGNEAFGGLSDDLLAIDGRHDGDALGARRLIVRATADRILEAIDRPTMLIFDDLHWTDELSLEVIGELARHAADRPLLLLGGYRADEFPADTIHREWRARLLSQRHAEEVRLRPLTLEETAVATTLILGGELPAPRDVVEAVHERTNGIPLHIEELLAALDDDARTDGRRIREAHVPDTIGDAVLARLARLSDDARTVARAGRGRRALLQPGRHRRDRRSAAGRARADDRGARRRGDHLPVRLHRPGLLRLPPPAPARRDLRLGPAVAAAAVPRPGGRVRDDPRGVEHRPRLAPLRAGRSSTAGLPGGADGRPARRAGSPPARRRTSSTSGRSPTCRPTCRSASRPSCTSGSADAAGAIERNEECATRGDAGPRALPRGRPAARGRRDAHLDVPPWRPAAARRPRSFAPITERALAEIAGLPADAEREKLRAFLLSIRADDRLLASRPRGGARDEALAARELAESVGDRETVLEADLLLARIDIVDGRYETGLRDGMRAAREARDAGFESVGVTGYRNLAIMAARIMDRRSRRGWPSREGLQYADAIEQSHCRQMMATTTAILDWARRRLGRGRRARPARARRPRLPPRRDRLARRRSGSSRSAAAGSTRPAAGSRSRSRPGGGSARSSSS